MRKFIAILLAFVLLLGNVGVTFGTHYCGDKAVETSISLLRTEMGCGMSETQSICTISRNHEVVQKKRCCENQYRQVVIEEEAQLLSVTNLKLEATTIILPLFIAPHNTVDITKTLSFLTYSPPLLAVDIPVFISVLLV